MISAALARRSQELAAARTPFVTATVVRAQSPTSVKAGSAALVLGDGTIDGFVGGSCTEQSVRAYSQIALRTGEPVLLRILPDGPMGDESDDVAAEEGAVTVRNPCLSGGAIEVFLEPSAPAPRVLVFGDTPIAAAVARIGAELELDIVAVGEEGPEPQIGDLAMIVAAHGRDELQWLRRALEAEVRYVGLVASERRGSGVLADLRGDGVSNELLARIDVPAGIAIGSLTPGEIALSILARVVEARRTGEPLPVGPIEATPAVATAAPLAVDPTCGMTLAAVEGTPSLERDGETFYFCCEGCKTKFEHASVGG
jgi:xanthine dehydrogenase accessory factor